MAEALETRVRARAGHRCEYCQFPSWHTDIPFQIDHIIARQHGGPTMIENLALACLRCNKQKGPNLTSIDPQTGDITRLFHPREHRWEDHFGLNGPLIIGTTPVGRATANLLDMNHRTTVSLRTILMNQGVYFESPPKA